MAGENAFKVEGRVIEVLPNKTWRVALANGHQVLAFVAGRRQKTSCVPRLGQTVRLAMSPYDLSSGRIIVETEKGLRV